MMHTTRFAVAIVLLTVTASCAHRSPTTASTPATGPAGATTGPSTGGGATVDDARGRGAGAQAAARLTAADLDARMKIIGPAMGTLRMKLMNNQLADGAKDAQTLATAFGDVERFFQQHNKSDAVMWAQRARMAAQDTAGAATAGDGMKAAMAATNLQSNCSQCHTVYREGDAQSGYRLKAGTVTQ
jgi:hypothetical protein